MRKCEDFLLNGIVAREGRSAAMLFNPRDCTYRVNQTVPFGFLYD